MRKLYLLMCIVVYCALSVVSCNQYSTHPVLAVGKTQDDDEGEERYDGAWQRDSLEFEKTKDPALGYVPTERLTIALQQTQNRKQQNQQFISSLSWTERGPISDTIGVSNGNTRAGLNSTSGFTTAILIDTLNDPSGNTVLFGGTTGGIWKCTNFLSPTPNWHAINDYYETLNIGSICQDPTSPSTMYFATGTQYYGSTTFYGDGIWKSTDAGNSWAKLISSAGLNRAFKIMCDASGNIYTAQRAATVPVAQPNGLFRSKDHGATWINITPLGLTSDQTCTDIEISGGGRLQASFGYEGTLVNHRYTDDPANVIPASGWVSSTGIRDIPSPPAAIRLELAGQGTTIYAVTVNSLANADSCYKSTDNGATWTKQNTTAYPTGVLNRQGDYDLTLSVNPSNANEFIIGGLDAYKSADGGITLGTAMTHWVGTTPPYVHADHHFLQWWNVGAESRIVIGCDGGIFLSRDGGATFNDRNKGLAVKQFYSCAIHPTAGSPYLLGGAQDNGTHKLEDAGLGNSTEVKGGDGGFVHINQLDPQIQFGAFIYSKYSRSNDGGATWQSINISNFGVFTNPFDYDDGQNIMYASNGSNAIRRWPNANSSNGGFTDILTLSQLTGSATAVKLSPNTPNRIFVGSSVGKLVRVDNANTVTNATIASNTTDITGPFPAAYLNCVNVGSSDQFLVAVYTNFGVNNIWYSSNGGSSWSAIDGDLPDMPVRWALFDPQHDDKLFIATAAGVYHTDLVNGASTTWIPETGFPTVRTDMLQLRPSDNTIVAATYGRGMFTAVLPSAPEIRFTAPAQTVTETTAATTGCRNYKDYPINVALVGTSSGDATVNYTVRAGNTALPGKDFDFTTNGNFLSPSTQHVFTSGPGQTKTVTIRVYDDVEVEPVKSFTLDLSVSGATNAVASSKSSFILTIKDDDTAPISLLSSFATIGTASATLGNTTVSPVFDARLRTKRFQILYTAAELNAAGLSAGKITTVALNLVKNSVRPFKNISIWMGTTSIPYLVNGFFTDVNTDLVKSLATYNTVGGWNTFTLDTPFAWDGINNLVVEFCYDNLTTDNTDFADPVWAYSDPLATSTQGNIQYQDGNGCFGFTSIFYYSFAYKPQAQFNGTNNGSAVATSLNASKTEYLGPNADIYFYSAAGVLMARVQNLSNFDYGCTQVVVDRAGNTASPFWYNTPANLLMNKTFHIIPQTNNPSGQYQLTLYYTQAEVNGWQSVTGNIWPNIQLVKTDGQISSVTPATPNGAGTVTIIPSPVLGTFGTDYTITSTFNTGFSGFGLGIPGAAPVPVSLLSFTGHLDKNTSLLEWRTSSELNSKDFDIEKSTDDISYNKIGTVPAAGNSSGSSYSFRDNRLNPLNYYRLRMNDLDGRSRLSQVVLIKYSAAQNLWVISNPFTDHLQLRSAREAEDIRLQLYTTAGSVVLDKVIKSPGIDIRCDVPADLSKGSYILKATIDGTVFTKKVIKQ